LSLLPRDPKCSSSTGSLFERLHAAVIAAWSKSPEAIHRAIMGIVNPDLNVG
jgi:hypothetical protein